MKYFKLNEFDSPDAPGSGSSMDPSFLELLDTIRGFCDFPFHIDSGFRTPQHNQDVGGKDNSAHLRGHAADISCTNDHERFLIIKFALMSRIVRLEVGKTWIHLDNDPTLDQEVVFLP